MTKPEIQDHLPNWIKKHLKSYLETDGREGHIWQGVPTLLLWTTGRKSGNTLLLPLIYGRNGDDYIIVASKGGAPAHPAWYLNLCAHPDVEVQVQADKFRARARTVTAEERTALWPRMCEIWPQYDEYQSTTEREIPIVALRRQD